MNLLMKNVINLNLLKTFILITLLIQVTALNVDAEVSKNLPETQKQKEGYSIGYQLGMGMKYDGAEVDYDYLFKGLLDATDGNDPLLSKNEMRSILVDLKKNAREYKLRKIQETIVRNAEEAKAFLEENSLREGIKTTDSGLQYKILKEGSGATPTLADMVKVHYRGMFTDGTEFDNSYDKGKPQTFQTDGVIKGWTEALQMMKERSKWQLYVPPELAYGRTGLEGTIPPNKVLVFEIELISIEKKVPSTQGS